MCGCAVFFGAEALNYIACRVRTGMGTVTSVTPSSTVRPVSGSASARAMLMADLGGSSWCLVVGVLIRWLALGLHDVADHRQLSGITYGTAGSSETAGGPGHVL